MIKGRNIHFGPLLWESKVEENFCHKVLNLIKSDDETDNDSFSHLDDARATLAGKIEKEYFLPEENLPDIFEYLVDYAKSYVANMSRVNVKNTDAHVDDILEGLLLQFSRPWINIQTAKEYNPPHTHTGDLSYVLYLDISPEMYKEENISTSAPNGSIDFFYGSLTYTDDFDRPEHPNNINKQYRDLVRPLVSINLEPVTGTILFFPSYLFHFVHGFNNPKLSRISMSGNIQLRGKEINQ